MPDISHPIVGAYYRPPAKALLSVLPMGAELILAPEPDNEHDPNAIAVWLPHAELAKIPSPNDDLDSKLAGYGMDFDALLSAGQSIHLGYVPRVAAAQIELSGTVKGELTFGASGGPRVRFDLEPS